MEHFRLGKQRKAWKMDTQNEANKPTERERAAMAIGNLLEEARQEGFKEALGRGTPRGVAAQNAIENLMEEAEKEGYKKGYTDGELRVIQAAKVAEATKRAEELSKRRRSLKFPYDVPPADEPDLEYRYERGAAYAKSLAERERSVYAANARYVRSGPTGAFVEEVGEQPTGTVGDLAGSDYLKDGSKRYIPVWTGTSFSAALEWLKDGNKVARHGWNGQGQYVYANNITGSTSLITGHAYLAHTMISTVNGNRYPWFPSQGDLFADDWYMVT